MEKELTALKLVNGKMREALEHVVAWVDTFSKKEKMQLNMKLIQQAISQHRH
jgi:hypothetical protein